MRILQLSPQVPYPPSDGGKVSIFNVTKYLAKRGHRITMLALEQEQGLERGPLQEVCELVTVPHSNKNSVLGAIRNLFSDIPYNTQKYVSRRYMDALRQLLGSTQFDIVHVDHLHLAPYGFVCRDVAKLPIVLREQNIESLILKRFAENVQTPIFRQWLDMQARRIQAFERNMVEQFDACCVISEEDRNTLLKMNPRVHARVIPAGVEERYFQPSASHEKKPHSIALVGNFEWLPNRDALLWFLSDIFPKIHRELPDATLYIIGKKIPAKVHQMQHPRIVLRGYVPDMKEELQQYDLSVVPLRVGGGMRLKIVESFAMRVPVVSTSIGREGIPGNDGEHLLVADSIDLFAAQVVRLLREPKLRNALAEKAFQFAKREYRWERIAEEFEHTYEAVREHASKGLAVDA